MPKVVIRSRELKKGSQYNGQKNNNVDIKFSAPDAFFDNLHQVRSKQKYWKAK
jgi:hypothetical protein